MGEGLKSSAAIDADRLAEEAGASEHGEAYQQMGRLNGVSVGVGAREVSQGRPVYFVEFTIPVCPGPEVDLGRLSWITEVLGRLKERGYSLTCQDDMSFSCELTTHGKELEEEYEEALTMVARP